MIRLTLRILGVNNTYQAVLPKDYDIWRAIEDTLGKPWANLMTWVPLNAEAILAAYFGASGRISSAIIPECATLGDICYKNSLGIHLILASSCQASSLIKNESNYYSVDNSDEESGESSPVALIKVLSEAMLVSGDTILKAPLYEDYKKMYEASTKCFSLGLQASLMMCWAACIGDSLEDCWHPNKVLNEIWDKDIPEEEKEFKFSLDFDSPSVSGVFPSGYYMDNYEPIDVPDNFSSGTPPSEY